MAGYIDLKTLNMDELVGVVNLYPWFGSARKELCYRMANLAGSGWGESQYADAAMYIPSRSLISELVRKAKTTDYSDKNIEELLKSYIEQPTEDKPKEQRQVRVVGGDFFTQDQYDKVRKDEDNVFSRFAAKVKSNAPVQVEKETETEFFTETLAEIYIEQGYYTKAAAIYSKLILRYPEKSAYFATLIEKLNQESSLY